MHTKSSVIFIHRQPCHISYSIWQTKWFHRFGTWVSYLCKSCLGSEKENFSIPALCFPNIRKIKQPPAGFFPWWLRNNLFKRKHLLMKEASEYTYTHAKVLFLRLIQVMACLSLKNRLQNCPFFPTIYWLFERLWLGGGMPPHTHVKNIFFAPFNNFPK